MKLRKLGSQGLTVSEQGLGCMGMSVAYGPTDDAESIRTVHRAIDLGVTLLDTADMYGPYTNERLLGRAVKGRRDGLVIASKAGNEIADDGTFTGRVNGRPDYLRKSVDGTLRRLGVDHLDLYYLHRVDPATPIEESAGALGELVAAGKVRHLGLSEASAATIRRAHAVHPFTAVQTEYSLFTREVETNGVLASLRELGIGFVAYSPLGRGFLSGRITSVDDLPEVDFRRIAPRFQGANFDRNLEVVRAVVELAARKEVTPSQLALAWVLAQGDDVVALPGTKRRAYLEENVAASRLELTAEDLKTLDEIAPPGVAAGDRYPADAMAFLDG
ncbi:aldo/keto reductase [Streptomyces capillispiralis]|uniref:Aryl-alcohol dehydrogenase-like predicted oxidoreductase n=1 Tax=Streptomyces capillispiralis TaxID=68182 RepID=A0A561TCH5_9ACTN|nr:aldo/keto reductase [Streptomyces capillispiralis]TWF84773.1 aryl-alcohol dehydrogenase-like predicted oxidoreductase [Streptomyces capillispiralis]GHH96122.1 oxidoreductase [Streptomyces capillispiralis]